MRYDMAPFRRELDRWLALDQTVFPLAYRSRMPLCRWTEYREAPPSQQQMIDWFSIDGYRGMAVLPSRPVVAIDFDDMTAYTKWSQSYHLDTLKAKSNRGVHVWVKCYEVDRLMTFEGGDIMGNSEHMITVPPTIHHTSGQPYTWINDKRIIEIDSLSSIGIEPIDKAPVSRGPTRASMPSTTGKWTAEQVLAYYGSEIRYGKAACPLHSDSSPSRHISQDGMRSICYSTKCPASRRWIDSLDIVMLMESCSFQEAKEMQGI